MPEQVKHTPGQWVSTAEIQQLDLGENFYILGGLDGACHIAEMLNADHFPCIPDEEVEDYETMVKANARLIAAAPDMLAALEAIHNGFVDGSIRWTKKRQSESDPYHSANTLMSLAFEKVRGDAV